jgi:ribosomal protein S18 acetylase RimI-like enzyme
MSSIRTRPAAPAELPGLVELVNSAYRGDSSRRGWTTEADLLGGQRTDVVTLGSQLEAATVLVAEDAGRFVGCVLVEPVAPAGGDATAEAYLGMLTVDPKIQTRGIGSALVEAAEAFARETLGAQAMRMTVIAQRSELLAWYERRGYVRTGQTEPFPYGDARFGLPKRDDLYFVVLRKPL